MPIEFAPFFPTAHVLYIIVLGKTNLRSIWYWRDTKSIDCHYNTVISQFFYSGIFSSTYCVLKVDLLLEIGLLLLPISGHLPWAQLVISEVPLKLYNIIHEVYLLSLNNAFGQKARVTCLNWKHINKNFTLACKSVPSFFMPGLCWNSLTFVDVLQNMRILLILGREQVSISMLHNLDGKNSECMNTSLQSSLKSYNNFLSLMWKRWFWHLQQISVFWHHFRMLFSHLHEQICQTHCDFLFRWKGHFML